MVRNAVRHAKRVRQRLTPGADAGAFSLMGVKDLVLAHLPARTRLLIFRLDRPRRLHPVIQCWRAIRLAGQGVALTNPVLVMFLQSCFGAFGGGDFRPGRGRKGLIRWRVGLYLRFLLKHLTQPAMVLGCRINGAIRAHAADLSVI